MKKLVIGILAHVDAGKTTLSEALLYRSGAVRKLGRVDHRDAFLDTDTIERERGITIFSKQAQLPLGEDLEATLLDTPGHVDFSAEMERTLQVLDCAILVISGTDGVQAHTRTVWRLLERYGVPTFLFINKMDLAGAEQASVLSSLRRQRHGGCVDFTVSPEELAEAAEHAALESGREHILYSEMILNPTHWPQFSVPEIIAAVTAGFDRAAAQGGADCRFTLSLSRTQTGAEAMALVEDMKAHRTHRLAGLSIDGNEALAGRTGERFRPAFLAAGAAGFGRTAHAGESSGPDGVRDALDLLEADRLDHGVRAAEDADLTARLVRERVPLNICLTSNLTLLYRRREDHPLRRLLDAGAVVTLSRDDPTFLGGLTLTEELRRAAEFAYMSREELLACQEAAVDAASCGPETKNFLRRALAEFQQS